MAGATVGAYAASGLRNQSWQPTVFVAQTDDNNRSEAQAAAANPPVEG